nr:uncharacterized protein LOC113705730 [Coffea arabica]
MGFSEIWINWIMECITTATFSFNINEESKGYITSSRGIRQGDPLSPYLFLLVSEGFSNLLTQAESNHKLILETYEQGSGQMMNMKKSLVFFSKNVDRKEQKEICSSLGNIQVVHQGKYLGLPIVIPELRTRSLVLSETSVRKQSLIGATRSSSKQAKRFY